MFSLRYIDDVDLNRILSALDLICASLKDVLHLSFIRGRGPYIVLWVWSVIADLIISRQVV
jgi:hypothetical protein